MSGWTEKDYAEHMAKFVFVCESCGAQAKATRGGQRKFCSKTCGEASWRAQNRLPHKVSCEVCRAEFECRRKRSTCSVKCKREREAALGKVVGGPTKGWSKGREFAPRTKCHVCGSVFYAPPSQVKRANGKPVVCSKACVMASARERWPQTVGRRGIGGKRSDLGGVYFRSAWEANWARYLNWLVARKQIERWQFEPDTFEFVGIKRGSRFYTPDFKVFDSAGGFEYHEIKGYMDARSATKLNRMSKYYPDVKVKLISKTEYRSVASVMAPMLEGWESRR